MDERICKVEGCNNVGEINKKKRSGKLYRRPICTRHRRIKYGQHPTDKDWVRKWKVKQEQKCKKCGWLGPCDIHRIIPRTSGGRYVEENIELICPNCHRLEHIKEIKLGNKTRRNDLIGLATVGEADGGDELS